jgi:Ras-related protein Rab-11A
MENNEKEGNNNIIDLSKYNIVKVEKDEDISNLEEITYKVIVIGDPAVGKSSIIQNLVNESEPIKEVYKSTIGFDIFNYSAHINEKLITMQIWDTCGLIDFSTCTPKLYNNVSLAIIVYEIDKKNTFDNIQNWLNLLKLNSSAETIVFIVGNKLDLEEFRKVSKEEGEKYVKDNEFKFFTETSAKDRKYVKEMFHRGLVELYELNNIYKKNREDDDEEERIDFTKRRDTFKLNKKKNDYEKNNSNSCCIIY